MARRYDAVVIGGGHNGLTSAAYLAKAGKRVLVLERRHVLGGAAVTEEIFPGFRFSVYSYVVSLLRPEIIRELELPKHGLEILPLDGTIIDVSTQSTQKAAKNIWASPVARGAKIVLFVWIIAAVIFIVYVVIARRRRRHVRALR